MLASLFTTKGTLNKSAYQKLAALLVGASFLTSIVLGALFPTSIIPTLLSFLAILLLIPGSIRRLRDLGKSGWWIIGLFVPLVGIFVFLYMLFGSPPDQLDKI